MTRPMDITKSSWMLTLASIVVVIAALYLGKGVLLPLTLAALLSFLLSPVCGWLERRGLSRFPAVAVTAILGFTLIGIVTWTATVQITSLAPKIPEYQHNIETKLSSVNAYAATMLRKITRTAQDMGETLSPTEPVDEGVATENRLYSVRVVPSPTSPLQIFGGMFGTLLQVLGTTGIVIVLVVFFLVQREDLRDRFIRLVGKGQVTVTTQMLEDAGNRVSRYLSMLFLVNGMFGICVGGGLALIGVPNAILWGILATALRFIPYIGPWIAAAMPIGLSMAISPGWFAPLMTVGLFVGLELLNNNLLEPWLYGRNTGVSAVAVLVAAIFWMWLWGPIGLSMAISPGWFAPLMTVGLFVVLELLNNNLLEPWLYGKNTGVSAVAVLMAAIFWMWLWGPTGLLLATPLTVCLLVIGKHVPQLSFLNILLGTDPVFEPKDRIYQRLLAGDQDEAADLLEGYLEHQSLVEVYDTVVIPALALGETHWQLGELNEGRHKFMMESLRDIVQDQGAHQRETKSKMETAIRSKDEDTISRIDDPIDAQLNILCLPARNEADQIAAMMLAQVLEDKSCRVEAVPVSSLARELFDLVDLHTKTDVICISATPPAAVMHARYLGKRLRERMPQVKLVAGLWDFGGDLNKASERIGCDAIVVTTLAEAQEQIRLLVRSSRPDTEMPSEPVPTMVGKALQ